MKGLTPIEVAALEEAQRPCRDGSRVKISGGELEIYRQLIESGRASSAPCPCHGIPVITVTAAGHEALKLWRLLRDMEQG